MKSLETRHDPTYIVAPGNLLFTNSMFEECRGVTSTYDFMPARRAVSEAFRQLGFPPGAGYRVSSRSIDRRLSYRIPRREKREQRFTADISVSCYFDMIRARIRSRRTQRRPMSPRHSLRLRLGLFD